MNNLIHRSPSVGSLVKKIMAINPDLSAQEIMRMIRQSTHARGEAAGDYASLEVVNEEKALALAQASLKQ